MIEVSLQLQKDNTTLRVISEEDEQRIMEFHPNQILRAKLYGVKKPRSVIQLNLYWALCKVVADNLEGKGKEDIDFDVKVALKHVKAFRIVNGVTFIEVGSISFANLYHLEACGFFDRAFPVMAKMIGVSTDELLGTQYNPSSS